MEIIMEIKGEKYENENTSKKTVNFTKTVFSRIEIKRQRYDHIKEECHPPNIPSMKISSNQTMTYI